MSNEGNNSNSQQETVTISTQDPQKIEELEKQLKEKDNEIKTIKEKTISVIQKIKKEANAESNIQTDLTKNIRKQNTFSGQYKNGYADGTIEKEKKKILTERKKAKAGTK